MVQNNNEAQDTVIEDTSESIIESTEIEPKRGRGRPTGSTNKANEDLSALKQEVQSLKNRISALDAGSGTDKLSSANIESRINASLEKLDLRVSIIQQWVEMFHMFLTTSRITNSADRTAEDELTIVISKLPEQNHPLFIGVHAEAES